MSAVARHASAPPCTPMPTDAAAIAAASLMPSPTMTTGLRAAARSTTASLSSGDAPPVHASARNAEPAAHCVRPRTGRRRRGSRRRPAAGAERGDGVGRVAANRIAESRGRHDAPSTATSTGVSVGSNRRPRRDVSPRAPLLAHERRRADHDALSRRRRPRCRRPARESIARRLRTATSGHAARKPAAIGCVDSRSSASTSGRTQSGPCHSTTRGASFGDRAGLVEEDAAGRREPLERVAALDEDPGARRAADRHRDGERRRQRERARTGDDEQRDRVVHRAGRVGVLPHDERDARRARAPPRRTMPASRLAVSTIGARRAALSSTCRRIFATRVVSPACSTRTSTRRRHVERPGKDLVARHRRDAGRDSPVSSERFELRSSARHDAVGGERLARMHGEHHAWRDRLRRERLASRRRRRRSRALDGVSE